MRSTKVYAPGERLRDQRSVALAGIGLEAEQTRAPRADDVRQRVHGRPGGFGLQVTAEDPSHLGVATRPGGGAAGCRRA